MFWRKRSARGESSRSSKRHITVDSGGRLLMLNPTPADIADSTGAVAVLDALKKRWRGLKHLFGDGAYDRTTLMDKARMLDFVVEVVRRQQGQTRFQVLPGSGSWSGPSAG